MTSGGLNPAFSGAEPHFGGQPSDYVTDHSGVLLHEWPWQLAKEDKHLAKKAFIFSELDADSISPKPTGHPSKLGDDARWLRRFLQTNNEDPVS